MRHGIQKAGHEVLPLLFMLVAGGTGVLFYLGNFWPGTPPGWVVIPVLVTLAVCTEWLTFTFNQDMQDAMTRRSGRGFPVVRALLTSAVSAFIFATASSGLWAPRGADDKVLWAWILAVGVFGSQFLLKLVPEPPKSSRSLVNISAAIEQWIPDASVQDQARIASQVFNAVATIDTKALPAPKFVTPQPLTVVQPVESAGSQNGTATFQQPNQVGNS